MTPVATACVILALVALALCSVTWRSFLRRDSGQAAKPGLRKLFGLLALLCVTASTAIYVLFVMLWAHSSHSFNGREGIGTVAICVGFLCASFALFAGLAARGIARAFIIISSGVALFLWWLAIAATAAV